MGEACLNEESASAFAQGALPQRESEGAEQHLDSCPECQQLVAMLAQLVTQSETLASQPCKAALDTELQVGERVGRFTVVGLAGTGAMSRVYEAHDPDLDRKVAVKLLRSAQPGQLNPRRAARLLAEARAMARLSHDHVIVVHEVGVHQDQIFIAMEYVEGYSLGEWLQKTTPTISEILEIFIKAGQGLIAAHRAGIVHRDFKPDNVLIGLDGRVRVSDFGLAMEPSDAALEKGENECVGTPAYMAPEQWRGQATTCSDQFSFCVALYEALVGRRPFEGETVKELLHSVEEGVVHDKMPRSWLQPLVLRGLAPKAQNRFKSMSVLLDALKHGRRKRQRIWGVAAAASMLALAAASGSALTQTKATTKSVPSCETQGQSIAAFWPSDNEERLRKSFLAHQERFAPAAWKQVKIGLDKYATRWQEANTQLCRNDSKDSALLRPERQLCLQDGRAEFAALIQVLAPKAPGSVARSVKAVAKLPSPRQCVQGSQFPGRQRARSTSAANQSELAHAKALRQTGNFALSLRRSQALVDKAIQEKDRPMELAALLVSSAAAIELGDFDQAASFCHRVAQRAVSSKFSFERAHAWATLVGLLGSQQAKFDDATFWAEYATAAIQEAGGSAFLEGMLANALGIIAKQQGQQAQAKVHYQKAIALYEQALGKTSLQLASILNNLAILEHLLKNQDAAIQLHRRALDIKEKALGPSHPSVGIAHMNIGILYGVSQPRKGRAYYQRSLEIFEMSLPPEHPYIALALINLGNTERRLQKYPAALLHLQRARPLMEARFGKEHPKTALLYENMAFLFFESGEPLQALTFHHSALLARQAAFADTPHDSIADSHHNIGFALLELSRAPEALVHFEQGLHLRRLALGKQHPDAAWDLLGVGAAQLALGKKTLALQATESAFTLAQELSGQDDLLADLSLQLATILADLRQSPQRALRLAEAALELYDKPVGAAAAKGRKRAQLWLATH